jgi:hypothetical protein
MVDKMTDDIIRNVSELAAYLHIGITTARKLYYRRGFPVVVISPRVRLIQVAALEKWLTDQRRK